MIVHFQADVLTSNGAPLPSAIVQLSRYSDGHLKVVAIGKVENGRLSVEGDVESIWTISINEQAIISWPARDFGEFIELSPIQMLDVPAKVPVLHSTRAEVWGLPIGVTASSGTATPPPPAPPPATDIPPVAFSQLVSNAAQQIQLASRSNVGLQLGAASLKLTGLASSSGDGLAMKFPKTTEELAAGAAMSQLAVSFVAPSTNVPPPETGAAPRTPNIIGYTKELALRKLASKGYGAQVRYAVVADANVEGTVVRQQPAAEQALSAGATVIIYIAQAPQLRT